MRRQKRNERQAHYARSAVDAQHLFTIDGFTFKLCSICEALKPIEAFHKHSGTRSGRQPECAVCKNERINALLNPLRAKANA